ncbi:MAG: SDR family NAD(P)-dependent oxidoreductase [Phycisphaerales bacterium]
MEFDGLHVVVTGGTGALGSAVVRRIVEQGGNCHVPCVDAAELDRFELAEHPRVRVTMGGELREESTVSAFYAGLPSLWASIHCAGGFAMSNIGETTLSMFLEMFDTNAVSCFLCCREAVRRMRSVTAPAPAASNSPGGGVRAHRGRIVNVSARPAVEPRMGAGMIPYAVSKSAVAAFTQGLAQEVIGEGILVNAVMPSIMDTRANRRAMPQADFSTWATLDEVAATICYLASPGNGATRGGLVPVYGGA